jgi:phosphoglycolate phosphatase
MSYHSLIFDLDGTLTDPLTGIVRCMNYALSSHNYQPRSEQEIKPYIGPPLEIALSELSDSEDKDHIKELVATYRERYGEFGYAENVVYNGIYELLDTLVSGCGNYGMTKSDQLRELVDKDIVKQNSLMIGDRDIDLISARQTGLSSAGVLWGYGSSEELTKEKPVFIVETPAQLTAALIDRM